MSIAWISHRGESIDAPENTLSAFKLSSARDVDGMECDIYFTSDKVVVCAHDSHTERTSQGVVKAEIPGTPFAELEKINVWNGKKDYPVERIPKFAGALKTLGADRTFMWRSNRMIPRFLRRWRARSMKPEFPMSRSS